MKITCLSFCKKDCHKCRGYNQKTAIYESSSHENSIRDIENICYKIDTELIIKEFLKSGEIR